eukprot:6188243-Pleurochrysis_carterae.AAC.2
MSRLPGYGHNLLRDEFRVRGAEAVTERAECGGHFGVRRHLWRSRARAAACSHCGANNLTAHIFKHTCTPESFAKMLAQLFLRHTEKSLQTYGGQYL